jgi:hypothetical protein
VRLTSSEICDFIELGQHICIVYLGLQGLRPYLEYPGYEKSSELPGDGDNSGYSEVISVEHMDGGHVSE